MENESKRRDTIVKIILIVIIIILLLHSCALSYSKTPGRTPSGNINVIEITCDKPIDCKEKTIPDGNENKTSEEQPIETKPNCEKRNGKYYDKDGNVVTELIYQKNCLKNYCKILSDGTFYGKDGSIVSENKYKEECEKSDSQKTPVCEERDGKYYDENSNAVSELDFQKRCMINICKILSDGTHYGANDNEIPEGEFIAECESEGKPYVKDNEFGVIDKGHNKITWNGSSDLKIFTNSIYELNDVIAPEMSNTYQFVIRNDTDYKMFYNMSFEETNPYNIDMRYKLKKNDTYIIDHYVRYDELVVSTYHLSADQHDTYYLEWKWFSGDNDTQAGRNEAPYNLRINVEAESTNG